MTTPTEAPPLTLVDFLRARLGEDETAAQSARVPRVWGVSGSEGREGAAAEVLEMARNEGCDPRAVDHFTRHDPARVLRDVTVKRAILDLHVPFTPADLDPHDTPYCDTCDGGALYPCLTLRFLAAEHAAHPDYDEAWRP